MSISATQTLQTLLLLQAPWAREGLPPLRGRGLAARARACWAASAVLRHHPLTRPWVLFVILTGLSALTSGNPGWSLWIARDTLRITVFYLILWYTRDALHADRLWNGFLLALTTAAAYGVGQAVVCHVHPGSLSREWLITLCPHPGRIRGPFSIYMTFADVLMLGALLFGAQLFNRPWREVRWMAPAVGLTLVACALTYARHAWLGLAAGIVVLAVTARRRARLVLVLLLVSGLGLVGAPASVRSRLVSMGDPHDVTARDRLAMWQSGLQMVRDHPWLGVGPGQVRAWYPAYRRPEAQRPSTGHLHSSPVHLAAERGLPAVAVWGWVWVIVGREAVRTLRRLRATQARERALVGASLAGVTGFLVGGLFQHTFGDGAVVMVVYALIALPWVVDRDLRGAPQPAT